MIRYRDLVSDTICAPITAPGYSGVAVVRVSGDRAWSLTKQLTGLADKELESHRSYLTSFNDSNGSRIDQVLVTCFAKDKSFTGDEAVEVSSHGSPLIVNKIIDSYLQSGCRSSEKGEFSFRAFYNGKIDLVQAESINQLITSENISGSKTFLSQLEGGLSEKFAKVEALIIDCLSHLEASIDFSEQDIDPEGYGALTKILNKALDINNRLLESYDTGKNLTDRNKVLLLGSPNVGKSSLFNKLVKSERAIVTEVAGTTRDMVSEQLFIGNHSVEVFDSAGLRDSDDKVEKIGIERGLGFVEKADLILYIVDFSSPKDLARLLDLPGDKTLLVFNKIDLVDKSDQDTVLKSLIRNNDLQAHKEKVSLVSAASGAGISELVSRVLKRFNENTRVFEGEIVTQSRHFSHLKVIRENLEQGLELINLEESPDLIAQCLQHALIELNELLGKEYNDEVLDNIFSEFCIGK